MPHYDYDFFVIGAGSAGVRAARIAGQHGARVGIAEDRYLGGTCVNVGCVPKKLLVYAAHFAHDFEDAAGYGWTVGEHRHDWARMIANKNTEIARLNGIYRRLLEGAKVDIHETRATLVDAHTVALGDRHVTADKILVATGGWPVIPDTPGAREYAISSNEAFFLQDMPERVVIVGGGYIAVEFAGIFQGLGAQVTQLYRSTLFLRGFDDDVRETLAEEIPKTGVDLRFRSDVVRIEKTGDCLLAHLTDESMIEADIVMYATGRHPNTAGLGLEQAGIDMAANGAIVVDDQYGTSVPNIYAIGDVTDRINLTPVATSEGHALADTLFGNNPRGVNYDNIPTAVFSTPPVGTVGLTEAEARERGPVDIYRTTFKPMKHTLSGRDERTMMKLVVDRDSQRILGCHMVGLDAPEIVQGLAIALNCGATKADFDRTIGLHPSAAEEFVTMRVKTPDPEPAPRSPREAA
ncbi:MAG: glutathione-disulfide reductase [Alphaproteobacteria bacterium]|jgi:glutathione reductase (NADPH)|nr:glutathione-disulfide reductase [Alphaproteobacteria bacterium]